jgi:hypothetical protein
VLLLLAKAGRTAVPGFAPKSCCHYFLASNPQGTQGVSNGREAATPDLQVPAAKVGDKSAQDDLSLLEARPLSSLSSDGARLLGRGDPSAMPDAAAATSCIDPGSVNLHKDDIGRVSASLSSAKPGTGPALRSTEALGNGCLSTKRPGQVGAYETGDTEVLGNGALSAARSGEVSGHEVGSPEALRNGPVSAHGSAGAFGRAPLSTPGSGEGSAPECVGAGEPRSPGDPANVMEVDMGEMRDENRTRVAVLGALGAPRGVGESSGAVRKAGMLAPESEAGFGGSDSNLVLASSGGAHVMHAWSAGGADVRMEEVVVVEPVMQPERKDGDEVVVVISASCMALTPLRLIMIAHELASEGASVVLALVDGDGTTVFDRMYCGVVPPEEGAFGPETLVEAAKKRRRQERQREP